jgi:parallel beta-helix repeat protein
MAWNKLLVCCAWLAASIGVAGEVSAAVNTGAAATPRQFVAQVMSSSDVVLTWKDVSSDETGFLIERSDEGGAWRPLTLAPANAQSFRDTLLAPQTRFSYRISAQRPFGTPVLSAVQSVVTSGLTRPNVFYVDALNGSDRNPGTETRAWQTLLYASKQLMPGDTLLVRGGTYIDSRFNTVLGITKSGTPDAWITYKAYPGETPKIQVVKKADGTYVSQHGIEIRSASYIIVDGFTVEGHAKDLTLETAMAAMRTHSPFADQSGITIEGRHGSTHHIIIRNNTVFDNPLTGINAIAADYVIIEGNKVYNNSWYSAYNGSGISILESKDFDQNTTVYKHIVRNNETFSNRNDVPSDASGYRYKTDGNGIIVDKQDINNYQGRTLIANNVTYGNGGRGVHMYRSRNIDVMFNTSYKNSTNIGESEISVRRCDNVRVYANIMVPDLKRAPNINASSTRVDFNFNIASKGGKPFVLTTEGSGGQNNLIDTDPGLLAQGAGALFFRLAAGSPAINSADTRVVPRSDDFFYAPRPRSGRADVGAIESF